MFVYRTTAVTALDTLLTEMVGKFQHYFGIFGSSVQLRDDSTGVDSTPVEWIVKGKVRSPMTPCGGDELHCDLTHEFPAVKSLPPRRRG